MKRCLILCRFSNDDRDTVSVANQERMCREAAAARSWEVVHVATGIGQSGARILRNEKWQPDPIPVYRELMEWIPRVDVLLAKDESRYHRDIAQFMEFWHTWLKPHNVELWTIARRYDLGQSDDRAMFSILGVMNGIAPMQASEKVTAAKESMVRDGQWPTAPPYGYERRDGDVFTHPQHWPVVVRIYNMFFSQGATQVDIALQLTREGIPSATGDRWRQPHISYILRNPFYRGKLPWHGEALPSKLACHLDGSGIVDNYMKHPPQPRGSGRGRRNTAPLLFYNRERRHGSTAYQLVSGDHMIIEPAAQRGSYLPYRPHQTPGRNDRYRRVNTSRQAQYVVDVVNPLAESRPHSIPARQLDSAIVNDVIAYLSADRSLLEPAGSDRRTAKLVQQIEALHAEKAVVVKRIAKALDRGMDEVADAAHAELRELEAAISDREKALQHSPPKSKRGMMRADIIRKLWEKGHVRELSAILYELLPEIVIKAHPDGWQVSYALMVQNTQRLQPTRNLQRRIILPALPLRRRGQTV